jgi:alpha-glucosidase
MVRKSLFALIAFFAANYAFAQPLIQPGRLVSLKQSDNGVIIKTENSSIQVLPYSDEIVRIRVELKAFPADFSYAVIRQPEGKFTSVKEFSDHWELSTDSLRVRIIKQPFRILFETLSGKVISEDYAGLPLTWLGDEVTTYKKMFPDEKFIGLGEKTGPLNRRGNSYTNWNTDWAYGKDTDPLYKSIPFYIGLHDRLMYGIFLDNSFRTKFNFGGSTDEEFMFFTACHGEMNYYLIAGKDIPRIIENYTWLTGRMPLPPYWSIGYQQCRWGYYPESELMSVAQKFRDKRIPCDVLYLDIDYMDKYKIFTWDRDRFPDPAAMTAKLNGMGFHLVTIVDPGIKVEKGYFAYDEGVKNDLFVKYPDGKLYVGTVWPGRCHFPDFTKAATREWWGSSFKHLTDAGVEGFWNDMNEPAAWGQNIPDILHFDFDGRGGTMSEAHNIYALNMTRGTYDGTKKLLNGKRPFLLSRAAFAGSQRYTAVWTGDNAATDDHMFVAVRLVNSTGLSGIAFCGADVGGFHGSPTQELFVRWMSIGCYTPFFRNHTAVNTNDQEPWAFGETNEELCRKILEQRYRLLPYLYSLFYEATQTGMPVTRALAIGFPFDDKIYSWDYHNEYLFGSAFLVAPVSSTQRLAKIYLPAGDWYRLSSDELYKGNAEYNVDAPLNDLPVFVKAGSIVPMQSAVQYTGQTPDPVLEIHIYKGATPSSFLYYEDDGSTFAYENGSFLKKMIAYEPASGKLILRASEGSYNSKFKRVRVVTHSPGKQTETNESAFGKDETVIIL